MKDRRLQVFRSAVEGLVESLEAMIRLTRWEGEKPEPLVASAAKLVERLGTADRLSSAKFNGPPVEANKVAHMCIALKRLDAAYVAYRQQSKAPTGTADATAVLETEIAATMTGASVWS